MDAVLVLLLKDLSLLSGDHVEYRLLGCATV
jgi:hypothetical protein